MMNELSIVPECHKDFYQSNIPITPPPPPLYTHNIQRIMKLVYCSNVTGLILINFIEYALYSEVFFFFNIIYNTMHFLNYFYVYVSIYLIFESINHIYIYINQYMLINSSLISSI